MDAMIYFQACVGPLAGGYRGIIRFEGKGNLPCKLANGPHQVCYLRMHLSKVAEMS